MLIIDGVIIYFFLAQQMSSPWVYHEESEVMFWGRAERGRDVMDVVKDTLKSVVVREEEAED